MHHLGSLSPHIPMHHLGSPSPQIPMHHLGSPSPHPTQPLLLVPPCPRGGSGGDHSGCSRSPPISAAPQPVRWDRGLGQDPPVPVTALGARRGRGCGGSAQRRAGGAGLPLIPHSRLLTRLPWAGISEDSKVEAPAFTDAIRMYRQSKEQYGTWDMLCGNETQVLSNLVMEELLPELRSTIGPRLKGKAPERQRTWIQVSDAVYRMVYELAKAQYDAAVARCEQERPQLESTIRTDMDQIITSKEHLASKIRAFVLPKAEVCVRNHVQPYIPSILEALMTPTSQGFAEAREVFFKEVTDMNMNVVNEGGLEKLVEYMEKLSHLAFHPVKMQSCYEKMDQLKLEGLQQRFDVSSTSVFKQRAQIHMRQQMDDAVYTFETLLHQELGKLQGKDDLCKSIQRILERVLKKFDYDSSTVRKKFFREALLQITIPFLLKKLAPTCKGELAKYQELIFEDFASFILVENTYEEVVLQSVMKDIMQGCWGLCVPGPKVPSGAGTRRAAPAPPVPGAEVSSGGQCATPALSPVPGAEVPSGTGEQRPGPASPVPRAGVPAEAEVPHATPRSPVPASPVPRAGVPAGAEVPHATPRSSVPASPVPGAGPPPVPSVPHAPAAAASPRAGVPAEAEVSLVTAAPPGAQSPSPACHQRGDKEPGQPGERSPPQASASPQSGEGVQTEF
uniref:Niban 1/2/3 domain-containing protein n=1 Tax=Ficedula albicollis TaxID=59894 RepID=U3JSG1_FICAL